MTTGGDYPKPTNWDRVTDPGRCRETHDGRRCQRLVHDDDWHGYGARFVKNKVELTTWGAAPAPAEGKARWAPGKPGLKN